MTPAPPPPKVRHPPCSSLLARLMIRPQPEVLGPLLLRAQTGNCSFSYTISVPDTHAACVLVELGAVYPPRSREGTAWGLTSGRWHTGGAQVVWRGRWFLTLTVVVLYGGRHT